MYSLPYKIFATFNNAPSSDSRHFSFFINSSVKWVAHALFLRGFKNLRKLALASACKLTYTLRAILFYFTVKIKVSKNFLR